LFGIPPYGGSIQSQVYYSNSTLCAPTVDTSTGWPTREIDARTGKMKPWESPFVLLVDRGDCKFVMKVRNAQRAGAAAVLIADNVCMCSYGRQCTPDVENQACETQEPIMADDGSGSDISIPSLLIFKQDADPIKQTLRANTPVRVEMSFSVPSASGIVNYELWTTPADVTSQPIEKNFKAAAIALGDKARFTPRVCNVVLEGNCSCEKRCLNDACLLNCIFMVNCLFCRCTFTTASKLVAI
jgi:hypothetical protein